MRSYLLRAENIATSFLKFHIEQDKTANRIIEFVEEDPLVRSVQNKLAIFLPALYGGGAERTMLKLAAGIADRGHPVDLVLARAKGPLLHEVSNRVNVVSFETRKDLFSLLPLVQYLRREKPHVLLTGLHTNLIALWAAKLSNASTKIAVSERNTFSIRTRHYRNDLRMRLMPWLIRRFYPEAEYLIAVSKGVAEDLAETARIPRERIHIIYNPVITPELKEMSTIPVNHPWFSADSPPVILGIGRLSAQKDFTTLLQAFSLVRQSIPCRLLILGEGEERTGLETLVRSLGIEEDVELPGFVDNPYPYMRNAAVFVLSSRWEGLPGVLIEALYCCRAIVSTDCPSGPREILQNGKTGQLVPVGDVHMMGKAIRKALLENQSPPSPDSWKPFELEYIVNQYLNLLFDADRIS